MILFKLGLRAFGRHGVWVIAGSMTAGALIGGAALMLLLDRALKPVVRDARSESTQVMFLESSLTPEERTATFDAISAKVAAVAAIEVKMFSREETVALLSRSNESMARELGALGGRELAALVPEMVSVSGAVSADVLTDLKGISGVERVESTRGKFTQAAGSIEALRWVLRLLSLAMIGACVTLLVQVARSSRWAMREEAALLSSWGAGRFQVFGLGAVTSMVVALALGGVAGAVILLGGGRAWSGLKALSPVFERLGDANISSSFLGAAFVVVALAAYLATDLIFSLRSGVSRR